MASALSGGEQKQLEVGRALLLRPKVLLIDEPSIGLSPIVVQDVFKLLRKLADQGTNMLMVEQNVKSALKFQLKRLRWNQVASCCKKRLPNYWQTRTLSACFWTAHMPVLPTPPSHP